MFTQFVYNPDYLKGEEKYRTNTDKVWGRLNFDPLRFTKSPLNIDGGNLVFCKGDSGYWGNCTYYVVMTDKVMTENPQYEKTEIERLIKEGLNCNNLNIIWLPWDKQDTCGHTDGILRYVGNTESYKPIVLTNLTVYGEEFAKAMREILQEHFEVIELQLSSYHDLSWAYINMLQMRDIIIVPGVDNEKTDREALEQIKALFPQYEDRIYQVQMKSLIARWGGALNCCSWTISEDMSSMTHTAVNDARYNELVAKALKDPSSIDNEELFFMGDYYPRRLTSISRR